MYHAGNMDVPDFSYYRRESTKDNAGKNTETVESRNTFTYVVAGGLGITGAYSAKALVNQFVSSWSASQVFSFFNFSKNKVKLLFDHSFGAFTLHCRLLYLLLLYMKCQICMLCSYVIKYCSEKSC